MKDLRIKLALVGDIHNKWDQRDLDYFNGSDYDAVVILGDLPGRSHKGAAEVARRISGLRKRAFLMPGNHDAVTLLQLVGEIRHDSRIIRHVGASQVTRCRELESQISPVEMCGYSLHTIRKGDLSLHLVAVRPHSLGGRNLSFLPYLGARFQVFSMEDSVALLRKVVDRAPSGPLFFIGHNGPAGLGEKSYDLWGCDFLRNGGDYGDPDFTQILSYAEQTGRRILGVAAGHMHHELKGKGKRIWYREQKGIPYINAARVPRIFDAEGELRRHHVEFLTDGKEFRVREVLVGDRDEIRREAADPDLREAVSGDSTFPGGST
jgi:uncharacterized protein (TIGR04168 family)